MPPEIERVRRWFLEKRRSLPWRDNPTPYRVWVSEVMLQQTQVTVVIPYFLRWMEKFPTLEALAAAEEEAVIKEWEGLGYYSRARNLHSGAKYVVANHGGTLPESADELSKIKGLGPYTIAAIRSFAFHKKTAPLDGNVIRLFSRLYDIHDDIAKPKTLTALRKLADEALPNRAPWEVAEAFIELGATICTRTPKCALCPLKHQCRALASGTAASLPFKSTKATTTWLYRAVPIITFPDNTLLIQKTASGQIMAGLYEFPYFETEKEGLSPPRLQQMIKEKFNMDTSYLHALNTTVHSFTRYRAQLTPSVFQASDYKPSPGYQKHSIDKLDKLPFSSGHRKILLEFSQGFCSGTPR